MNQSVELLKQNTEAIEAHGNKLGGIMASIAEILEMAKEIDKAMNEREKLYLQVVR